MSTPLPSMSDVLGASTHDDSSQTSVRRRRDRSRHQRNTEEKKMRDQRVGVPMGVKGGPALPRHVTTVRSGPEVMKFDTVDTLVRKAPRALDPQPTKGVHPEPPTAPMARDVLPHLQREYRDYLQRLEPEFKGTPLQQTRAEAARPRAVSTCLHASHDTALLVRAGTFHTERGDCKLPACLRGERCQARQLPIVGMEHAPEVFTLAQILTPTELEYLRIHLQVPADTPRRRCVLCYRADVSTAAAFVEANRDVKAPTTEPGVLRFYCTVNRPDGYLDKYCLLPDQRGLVVPFLTHPVPRVVASQLRVVCDARNNWRIDQSRLVWRPPPPVVPQAGERVSDF